MGCCGSGSSSNGAKASAPVNGGGMMAMSLPGAKDGMEILEYIGTSASDMTWYGPESKVRYVFGGNRKVGYVDKRDVTKMVALVDQGKPTFRVYQKLHPEVSPEPVEGLVEGAVEEMLVEIEEEAPELITEAEHWTEFKSLEPVVTTGKSTAPFDPSGFSVNALRKQLDKLKESELEALLEAERFGLNRKGALNAIGEVLNG